jgi:hypothetical protein
MEKHKAEKYRTANSICKNFAVQWLNDSESFRDCASFQVQCWQIVLWFEIANFVRPETACW